MFSQMPLQPDNSIVAVVPHRDSDLTGCRSKDVESNMPQQQHARPQEPACRRFL